MYNNYIQFQSKILAYCLRNSISNAGGNELLTLLNEAQCATEFKIPLDYRKMMKRIGGLAVDRYDMQTININVSDFHWSLADIPDIVARYAMMYCMIPLSCVATIPLWR